MNHEIRNVKIAGNKIYVNEVEVFALPHEMKGDAFLNEAFKNLEISYPKFYKMDNLCKLGFLAAEHLFITADKVDHRNTIVFLSNKNSSLQTDRNHFEKIRQSESYFPSPSIFVYTLPNIVIGEICIRHKIMGEGAFFLSENHNFEDLNDILEYSVNHLPCKYLLYGDLETENSEHTAHFRLLELKKKHH
ncbi:MAG: 3-oxoacyl-ACP synthase [Flavobacteriales bacterium]|nr:3-oxoacyl-ACP synthase [Flavobacteriales bacterium]